MFDQNNVDYESTKMFPLSMLFMKQLIPIRWKINQIGQIELVMDQLVHLIEV